VVSDAASLALRKVTSLSDFSISGILLWISFAIQRWVACCRKAVVSNGIYE
jgi:hypothetical protein